jgi:uncharacterized protein YlxW (UPF0749 family)
MAGVSRRAERRFAPDFLTEMFRNPLDPGYAVAAARQARTGPPPRRRRVAGRAARGVVLVAAGFLLAVAYQQTVAAQPESARTRQGLAADVRSKQDETDQLQKSADALRDEVNRARDQALAGAGPQGVRDLEVVAGLGKVHGDGVEVELTDAPQPLDPVTGQSTGKNGGQVLDRDLQDISNELWRDGAEAIAINGVRLTATTTIRTAGNTILVDFKPIVSPYQIVAIGPGDLNERFNSSDTAARFHRYTIEFGMGVSVRARFGLTLAAAPDPQLRYARTVPAASPAPSATPGAPATPSANPSASGGR